MKRSDADAPSTPTVLLRFAAAQVQPTAGSRLGPGARLEDAAWRPGVQADTPPLPALAPPVRISASTPDGPLIGETRSAPQQVALNARTAGDLNMVNRLVNSLITFSPDIKTYGVADYWAEPIEHQAGPIRGDCEDYVLEKRRALIARGFPAAALSIAVVRTRLGEDHAILLVATDRGELVLDSLSPWIVGWRDAPYTWVERQVPGAPMVWVKTGSRPKLLHTMIAATGDAPGLQPAAG